MNKEALLTLIKNDNLYTQNSKVSFLVCNFYFHSYVKYAANVGLDIRQLTYCKNDFVWQFFLQKESDKLGEYVYKSVFKWKLRELKKTQERVEREVKKLFKKELYKLSKKELYNFLVEFEKLFFEWTEIFFFGEEKGQFFEKKVLENFKGTQSELYNLTHPKELSEINNAHKILLDEAINPGSVNFKEFSKNYFWLKTDFMKAEELTPESFKELITKEKKKGLEKIRLEIEKINLEYTMIKEKQKKLKNYETKEVELLREFVGWADYRKTGMMKSFYYILKTMDEVSKRLKISRELTNYYLFSELIESIKKGKTTVSTEKLENRKNSFAYIDSKGRVEWFGKDAEEINLACQKESKLVKGTCACKGKVKGKIKIVLDPLKTNFKQGEILVTSMTRVEYIPFMRKAAAVVTNEGGIACHAAIISRELNIPCIIGTKNATKSLKDGDKVEVDADKGVVRKIK